MCSCVCMCTHTCTCMPFLWKTGHWMPGHLLSFGTRWAMTSTHSLWNVLAFIWKNSTLPVWAARRTSASCCRWKLQFARDYYVIQRTLLMSVLFLRIWIILERQGDVVVPCPRQREMEKKVKAAFSVKRQYLLVMSHHRRLSSWSLL